MAAELACLEPQSPELIVLIGVSGAGKSTLAGTWPLTRVVSLDQLRGVISDDFSVKFCVSS
jgi:predicted kinase